MPSAEQEAMSQSEYQRGVSAWNFDVEDLKAQASMVRDDDDDNDDDGATDWQSSLGKLNENNEPPWTDCKSEVNGDDSQQVESVNRKGKLLESDILESGGQQATDWKKNRSSSEATASTSETDMVQAKSRLLAVKSRQNSEWPTHAWSESENQPAIEKAKCEVRRTPSFSGPLMLPNRASANSLSAPIKSSGGFRDTLDDKSKANLVQIKGRFSVTSENLDLVKDIPSSTIPRRSSQVGSPLRKSASVGDWVFDTKQMPVNSSPKELNNSNVPASLLLPHLQNLFQQTSIQQDIIVNLLSSLQSTEVVEATQNGKLPPLPRYSENNGNVEPAVSDRERILLLKVSELQSRMNNLNDELTAEKMRHIQLQQQLNAVSEQEENGDRR
ncbi:hypothetical protein M0R45_023633 [Rubus argutus]|uniref:Uncharacterized protein n=1 Tax=Rubus argutus TaxID=59490 RepID=A0AAW1WSW6_RUBAR